MRKRGKVDPPPPKKLKVHLYEDCTGFYYSQPEDVKFTKEIREVTCGQCKGRILEVLRAENWALLPRAVITALSSFMKRKEPANVDE